MLQKSLLFLRTAVEDENNEEESLHFTIVAVIGIIISILGLIANSAMLWLLCWTIKKTKFTVYAANMAVGDINALLEEAISLFQVFTPFVISIRGEKLLLAMYLFGYRNNSFFLAAMSIERCLTVFSPGWYQSHRRKCSTALICTFIWTLSVILRTVTYFLCDETYISLFNITIYSCDLMEVSRHIRYAILYILGMVFPSLALLIRMKLKPQQDFPVRLDISIWVTVVLHLILYPVYDIISVIILSSTHLYPLELFYLDEISFCLASSANPFVYLFVGCWKWKKGQEPFYVFLERALKDEREGRMRTQPEQEEA